MALKVRLLTAPEADAVKRFARSRTAPHRVVQRAQSIGARVPGEAVPDMARHGGLSAFRVRAGRHRVPRHGLAG
jgi:hypothetical protein